MKVFSKLERQHTSSIISRAKKKKKYQAKEYKQGQKPTFLINFPFQTTYCAIFHERPCVFYQKDYLFVNIEIILGCESKKANK